MTLESNCEQWDRTLRSQASRSNKRAKSSAVHCQRSRLKPEALCRYARCQSFSYLANSITAGERSIPYSLVTGLDESGLELLAPGQARSRDDIILNEWAARELGARPGDPVSLDYYVWHEDGRLETRTAKFRLAAVVPIKGLAADKDLVPEYPGITGSEHLADWDPPFPVDLKRIRKQDEDYWDQYRTTQRLSSLSRQHRSFGKRVSES